MKSKITPDKKKIISGAEHELSSIACCLEALSVQCFHGTEEPQLAIQGIGHAPGWLAAKTEKRRALIADEL